MKLEQSEFFLIEELFRQSQEKGVCSNLKLLEVDKLTGDASTRRYYRLYTTGASLVVCLDNPYLESFESHPFLSVQNFLYSRGIAVPQVFDHNLGKGYLLQEDLGNDTLINILGGLSSKEEEREIYKKIIDKLVMLHRILPGEIKNPNLFQLKFDEKKLMDETRFTLKYFINFFLKNNNEEFNLQLENLFQPIMQRLASEKMVITHRDFHSRNIMLKNNELYFIDFQDARWGIPQYDLVSLLEDCYYDLDEDNKMFLKRYYLENIGLENLSQKSNERFDLLYQDMTIQRVFKAVGSFCYIYNWRKDERYLKYIGFAMEKLRKVMMKNPEYHDLKKSLFNFYYAN